MRLILHIGTPKTATTTIQNFVYANRATLLANGVLLTDALHKPSAFYLSRYCVPENTIGQWFLDKNITTPTGRKQYFDRMTRDFAAEITTAAMHCDRMFISSEHLYANVNTSEMLHKLHDFLKPHFTEIKVLAYFREQTAFAKSWYSTLIKNGGVAGFDREIAACTPSNLAYNYHRTMSLWAEVFGRDALDCRLFQTEQFLDGDIRKDVLQVLLSGPDYTGFDFSIDAENQSLGDIGIQLGLINNRINPRRDKDRRLNELRKLIADVIDSSELGKQGKLPFLRAPDIYEKFQDSNLAFAKDFLNRQHNPFPRPPASAGIDETVEKDEQMALFLQFFSDLLRRVKPMAVIGRPEARNLQLVARRISDGTADAGTDATLLNEMAELILTRPTKVESPKASTAKSGRGKLGKGKPGARKGPPLGERRRKGRRKIDVGSANTEEFAT